MSPEERAAILGPEVLAEIQQRVDAAPTPPDELLAELRGIFGRPIPSQPARTTHDSDAA